jgi:hypothetical protein
MTLAAAAGFWWRSDLTQHSGYAGVWERLHQLVLDELSEAEALDRSRGCIDAVAVRSKRGAS